MVEAGTGETGAFVAGTSGKGDLLAGRERCITIARLAWASFHGAQYARLCEDAQPFEGIDPGVVTVAPADLDRVASDALDPDGGNVFGNARGGEQGRPTPLVDTVGATAGQAERPHVDQALFSIGPADREGAGVMLLDPSRDMRVIRGHDPKSIGHVGFVPWGRAGGAFRG